MGAVGGRGPGREPWAGARRTLGAAGHLLPEPYVVPVAVLLTPVSLGVGARRSHQILITFVPLGSGHHVTT